MARAVTLGNGSILVGLDYRGQVRDFYFPFVGYANHVSGASGNYVHRIGVYVDGEIAWLDNPEWHITVKLKEDAVIGELKAVHERLGITLTSTDAVHNEKNVFLRALTLENAHKGKRTVQLFMGQQFRIGESRRGDTGFYDPRVKAVVHYKGHTNFLVNAMVGETPFDSYNIGLFGIEGKEGTYKDAEDGVLSQNPIEHGSVDSVIGCTLTLTGGETKTIHYWVVVGETIAAVHDLNAYVREETPERLIASTEHYWHAWSEKDSRDRSCVSAAVDELYRRSLLIMRVHADNHGGIIASSDTDMLHHGRDTYSYVWPRDAAIIAHAFDDAGYDDVARRFFEFMTAHLERGGYLMHKYCTDGTLGSSWHPWIIDGQPEFPIQEDETALVVYMLYQHYLIEKDLEFVESLYNPFIEPAANFMVEFVESRLGLPQNSFDLWEEKFGISTYTASAVYASLLAAAQFAELLGKDESVRTYRAVAQRMREGILEHLFDTDAGYFIKLIRTTEQGDDQRDGTIDMSSFFGPLYFGVVEPDDERLARMFAVVDERLRARGVSEGYVRYEGDTYYTMHDAASPNPWVVTTLWVAQYHIMRATTLDDLTRAATLLEWTTTHATEGGVLAEQMHPNTGAHISTAPLVWSHAEFVLTVNSFVRKHAELSGSASSTDHQ